MAARTRRDIDAHLIETLTEMKAANTTIAEAVKGIHENLKTLNDRNILHAEKTEESQKRILEKLQVLTAKYWWLIIACFAVLAAMAGYERIFRALLGL